MNDDDIWKLIEGQPGSPAALCAVAGRLFATAAEATGLTPELSFWIGMAAAQMTMAARNMEEGK
jgi:hypothetical protein